MDVHAPGPLPPSAELLTVLESAARLQSVVPDAVLVGGSAAALYGGHRLSFDHDHVLADLRTSFDAVLEAIEETEGWVTDRVTPHKIVLGRLGDIEAGVRQLRRARPLEVAEITLPSGRTLRVPTFAEALRVKAYLLTTRNRVRDYSAVAGLSARGGLPATTAALESIDAYYADQHSERSESGGVLSQLLRQLSEPRPRDTTVLRELPAYQQLDPRWHDWDAVRAQCAWWPMPCWPGRADADPGLPPPGHLT